MPRQVFFMQLGDELYETALQRVANFCFTSLLSHQQAPRDATPFTPCVNG